MIKSFGLLILRISIGTMLIHHGYEKTADIENFANAFVRPLGLPFPIFLSYIAAYSEIYGSWLIIFGLLTRLGALSIVGTISVAIYHALATSGFNIYLLELLILYFGGAFCILCYCVVFTIAYMIPWSIAVYLLLSLLLQNISIKLRSSQIRKLIFWQR